MLYTMNGCYEFEYGAFCAMSVLIVSSVGANKSAFQSVASGHPIQHSNLLYRKDPLGWPQSFFVVQPADSNRSTLGEFGAVRCCTPPASRGGNSDRQTQKLTAASLGAFGDLLAGSWRALVLHVVFSGRSAADEVVIACKFEFLPTQLATSGRSARADIEGGGILPQPTSGN